MDENRLRDFPTDPEDCIPYDDLCLHCPFDRQCVITYCPRNEVEE